MRPCGDGVLMWLLRRLEPFWRCQGNDHRALRMETRFSVRAEHVGESIGVNGNAPENSFTLVERPGKEAASTNDQARRVQNRARGRIGSSRERDESGFTPLYVRDSEDEQTTTVPKAPASRGPP